MLDNDAEVKSSNLDIEPSSIDFGSLSPGQGATITINIHGGPGNVSVHSDQLKVSPLQWDEDQSNLDVTLMGGSSGELLWDEVALQINNQKYIVPVTARWKEQLGETQISYTPEAIEAQIPKATNHSKDDRTFRGKSCSFCGRNFSYNIDCGSWEQCTCSWYQKVWNISSHTYKELRYGVKDIPTYLQELWRVLLGKEKW
jgi:hypothetical protein